MDRTAVYRRALSALLLVAALALAVSAARAVQAIETFPPIAQLW